MNYVSYWDDVEVETIFLVNEFARGIIEGIHTLVCDKTKEFFLEDAWIRYSKEIEINLFWTNSKTFDGLYSAVAYPVIDEQTDTTDELILFGVI